MRQNCEIDEKKLAQPATVILREKLIHQTSKRRNSQSLYEAVIEITERTASSDIDTRLWKSSKPI